MRESLPELNKERLAGTVAEVGHRSKATLHERIHQVRMTLGLAGQAGLAAGLAWVAAHDVLGNPQPVFAPIAAVGTIAVSVGQRFRRTVELIIGVAVGVAIGDVLVLLLGTGPWQLGLVVTAAIVLTVFAGGSVSIVIQAAATAVLIVTLSPSVDELEIPRFIDAFVGGGIALLVTAILLPLNPLRVLNRAARPALDLLAEQLDNTAEGLCAGDRERVQQALDRLRDNKQELATLTEAIEGAKETALLSPARWHRRDDLANYCEAADPIDRAMRNTGTLIRRAVTLIEDGEPTPEPMSAAIRHLAEAVRVLRDEFANGEEPEKSRQVSLRAVSDAGQAYAEGVGFSGSVIVAQVRTTASDLMVASGISQEEANRLVRQSFGKVDRPGAPGGPEPVAKTPTAPPVG